jgi:hypothetical protein
LFTTVFSVDRDLIAARSVNVVPARALRSHDLVRVCTRAIFVEETMEDIKLCL